MSTIQSSDKLEVTVKLVTDLIAEQFPQWAHLPIRPVEFSGWDNKTFRLGNDMSIRLPSAQCYAAKVAIEQKWLPILAPHLSFSIPKPLAMGQPTKDYPFSWSVYRWIEGDSANSLVIDDVHLQQIALSLSQFLNELHKVNITGAPVAGPHNFWRGGPLSTYDAETKSTIAELKDLIDANRVTAVWQKALSSAWKNNPVWIHGDLSTGNILIQNNQLVAVIDFGGMAIGDPACDLVIAWTFFKNESRKLFKYQLNLDSDTWARARGWALWKALITLSSLKDKDNSAASVQLHIIDEILNEHEIENFSSYAPFKLAWEKADTQHQLPIGVPEKMVHMAYQDKKLISYDLLSGGCANLNIKIQLEGNKHSYILRIYLRDQTSAYREQKLGTLLKPTLPVPVTYYIGDCKGYRFAITDFMPGITLRDLLLGDLPHDINTVMHEVGVLLSKISSHTFSQAGFFDKDLMVIKPTLNDDYQIFVKECLQNTVVSSQLAPETIYKINGLLEKYGCLFPSHNEKSLVHADFDPANILVDKINGAWKVTGILDWEFAFSGSTLCDVANMLRYAHLMPPQFEEAFLSGLRSGNVSLPESWRISVHMLNLMSLLDSLVRSDTKNRPNQSTDILKLIDHIVKELSI